MNPLLDDIVALRNDVQAIGMARFFKTGKGDYGEDDRFLGVKVPQTRAVVQRLWRDITPNQLDQCLTSQWHEVRLAALLVMVKQFLAAMKKHDSAAAASHIDFYLNHLPAVNNWDLVDSSCYQLLGTWLLDRDADLLRRLATEGRTLWEQRIGIVSTLQFIRHGRLDDTFAIADLLLHHPHDLIHKAVGWMLREAGQQDSDRLRAFLQPRLATMPRTMLRYAIEKFPPDERQQYLHPTNLQKTN